MTLTGPVISLIPLQLEHVVSFLKYSAEPSLWEWWQRPPPVNEAAMRVEVGLALSQQAAGERLAFTIRNNASGELIGSTSFMRIEPKHRSAEIGGSWIGLPFHRSGVNREAKELLLRHAFGEMKMTRVAFQTDELNVRSRRAIEKLGAKFEGVLRQNRVVWNGRVRSSAIYSILKSEWVPGKL